MGAPTKILIAGVTAGLGIGFLLLVRSLIGRTPTPVPTTGEEGREFFNRTFDYVLEGRQAKKD